MSIDTSTFSRVSHVEVVGPEKAAIFGNLFESPALQAAKQEFAAIKGGRDKGGFQDVLASLAKSRAASEKLGETVLGIQFPQKGLSDEAAIARAARLAGEKFGTPAQAAEPASPAPQFTPGQSLSGKKQLS